MRVIHVGVFPPPYGGVSIHIKRLFEYQRIKGQDALIIDLSPISKYKDGLVNYSWRGAVCFLLRIPSKSIIHFHNFSIKNTFFYFLISFRHKTILSFHNERFIAELNSYGGFWKTLAIWFLNQLDYVIVDNTYCKKLAASVISKTRIVVIPEYIAPVSISPLNHDGIAELRKNCEFLLSSNAFQISFFQGKDLYGLDLLVELVHRLTNHFNMNVGMVFLLPNIGDEEYFNEINRRIKSYKLTERFCFVTEPLEDSIPVWQISDIVIRATNTDGNSLTVLEALSIMIPVVASDCSERPTGTILFKTRDVDDLCEKVRTVLTHLDFYRSQLEQLIVKDHAIAFLELYKNIESERT